VHKKSNQLLDICTIQDQLEYYDKLNTASQVRTEIDNHKLADNIIRYMAPHFYLDKITDDNKELVINNETDCYFIDN
jgi:hypothetical protein